MPAPRRRTPHRVDESSGAGLPRSLRQLPGIVDDGGGGDTGEVEELIDAEAQDLDDLGIEAIETAFRQRDDEVIERRSVPLDAGRYFGGEGAIAVVGERRARG